MACSYFTLYIPRRTLEGSGAMLVGMAVWSACMHVVFVRSAGAAAGGSSEDDGSASLWLQATTPAVCAYLVAMVLLCVVEAGTAQIDNLVLPPLYFALTGLASRHSR
jgi:hypothetical protein